jgi:DNA repair exonuclease SbcCD ATPase subunit
MRPAAITPLGGISNDQLSWQEQGRWEGRNEGINIGRQQGLTEGYNEGYANGYNQGYSTGSQEAHVAGYNEAIDEANLAIQNLQAQHAAYQQEVARNYQAYEAERDQLRQLADNQATHIQALEDRLVQHEQSALHYQTKIDNLFANHQRLTQESAALQEQCSTLTLRIQSLLQERSDLDETVENLTLAKDANRLKYQEQLAHYNKTLTFVNSILGSVKSTLELNPELEDSFSKLFAGEYKQSVDFRILVDDIKTAPHEDSDFVLLLPQTHEFILAMLKVECRKEL